MKKIISFMIVFSLLLTMQIPALASEPISVDDSDTYPLRKASSITPASEYYTINDHGDLVIFPTQEDYLLYVQSQSPSRSGPYGESWEPIDVLSSTEYINKFIDYCPLTPVWAKPYQYVVTSGQSFPVSGSIDFGGIELKIEYTHEVGVAMYISADPNRQSRLACYADVTVQEIEFAQYQYGVPTGLTRISTNVIIENPALGVKYRY